MSKGISVFRIRVCLSCHCSVWCQCPNILKPVRSCHDPARDKSHCRSKAIGWWLPTFLCNDALISCVSTRHFPCNSLPFLAIAYVCPRIYTNNSYTAYTVKSRKKYSHPIIDTSYLYKKTRKIWWYQYNATTPPLFPIIPSEELITIHPLHWGSSSIALQTFSALEMSND